MTRIETAYHEAGHAVLSAAINDPPRHVSIRPDAGTLGRSRARAIAGPMSIAQIYMAGFAGEHLLTGRRPRQLDQEIGFAIATRRSPTLRKAFAGSEAQDGFLTVREVLRAGLAESDDEIRAEVERLYSVARRSLAVVWRAVERMATALLEFEELDRAGVTVALGSVADLRARVHAVQRACGIDGLGEADRTRRASARPPP